jgi:gamma-glutamylcyclotransferase (GGCT)/AIG2-like uncharacterized protein YtfP
LTHLFVYGTLKSSFRNKFARRLAHEATLLGAARMRGRLYLVRWYPGLRPPRDIDDWVTGELYRLRMAHRTLAALDRYEDRQYRRVRRSAVLESGEIVRCWVYLWASAISDLRRIESGEWTG